MSIEENTHKLQPGVYQVFNFVSGTALDLDGINLKSIIGFPPHDGPNQKWEFSPLGKGYSIRNLHGGTYLTVEDGIRDGVPIVASPYPASWALEADDFEQRIWRIAWPNTTFLFDLADHGSQKPSTPIQLWTRYPFESCRLWRFVRCRATPEIAMIAKVPAPSSEVLKPSTSSTADTVIDVEGLKLGGNGELTITTTTTTTTTTVTKVARLNCP
ncbi:hypothetical protein Hypma_010814 [Hypsizygus marmoreus]|uniref:Ricin B lectin domain-containing protein n=1 Tax=Hypsizygus marmoreus TaxID=39966 RepID=A0A369JNQ9_HYPMA|nr:hypothetical protein Hypma_010814 [Hypsizygus marmoreus]